MKNIYFFIGTEAELIKVFPVIQACEGKFLVHIIASGQNDIKKSRIMKTLLNIKVELELSQECEIKKSAKGLLEWYINTYKQALGKITSKYSKVDLFESYMIVHGDTISTFMGACIGKKLGMKVCHVEAGLRSHNLFNPFPEEIDRILTSKKSCIHFAPGEFAANNLKKAKGRVINTYYNTILDSLKYSRKMPLNSLKEEQFWNQSYFVFVMHRQENLANRKFFGEVIEKIEEIAKEKKCVIILHAITKITMEEMGVFEQLKQNKNIYLIPRVDYFDFMKVLDKAEFVITDGGSNQEELFYMGKPCLIMRKKTERNEGIGKNAILYDGDIDKIAVFAKEYKKYRIDETNADVSPSEIIVQTLFNDGEGN